MNFKRLFRGLFEEHPVSNAPKDASMTLLYEVMHRPLDPSYAAAAEKRRQVEDAGGKLGASPLWRVTSLLLAVGLGFTTITGVMSLRGRAEVAAGARVLLRDQIAERTQQMHAYEDSISEKSDLRDQLQESLLQYSPIENDVRVLRDRVRTGSVAVEGPGLVVTIKDGPNVDASRDNRVRDVDVRAVVSALWGAGAESISVNGKRLTPTSAIRSAGDAILVDLTGLSSPYKIEAIGDPQQMETAFVKNPITMDLLELESRYGISTQVARADTLKLAAGNARTLIYARTLGDDSSLSSDEKSQGKGIR